jgi:hypothetical protein
MDLSAWWDRLAIAMQHPAFHAVVLALLIGLAATELLAHLLPESMPAQYAERLLRIVVLVGVMVIGYRLQPSVLGAGWSFFAGAAAPSIHQHLQAYAYARWPALQPKALRP